MKKKEVVALNRNLSEVKHLRGNIKFSYALNRNIGKLKPEIDALEETSKEYKEKRDELIKSFYKKDKKGEPVVEDNHYVFTDQKKLEKALEKFEEEQKPFLDKYNEILEEEVKVDLYTVGLDCFEGLYVISKDNKHVPISFSAVELDMFDAIIKE
jgi:seryl-tRNA synthetase